MTQASLTGGALMVHVIAVFTDDTGQFGNKDLRLGDLRQHLRAGK